MGAERQSHRRYRPLPLTAIWARAPRLHRAPPRGTGAIYPNYPPLCLQCWHGLAQQLFVSFELFLSKILLNVLRPETIFTAEPHRPLARSLLSIQGLSVSVQKYPGPLSLNCTKF